MSFKQTIARQILENQVKKG